MFTTHSLSIIAVSRFIRRWLNGSRVSRYFNRDHGLPQELCACRATSPRRSSTSLAMCTLEVEFARAISSLLNALSLQLWAPKGAPRKRGNNQRAKTKCNGDASNIRFRAHLSYFEQLLIHYFISEKKLGQYVLYDRRYSKAQSLII